MCKDPSQNKTRVQRHVTEHLTGACKIERQKIKALPHFSACNSPAPGLLPARCLSWGLHLIETAHILKLRNNRHSIRTWIGQNDIALATRFAITVNITILRRTQEERCPTLSCLGFWNPLSDDPARIVHSCWWLKLHRLHHITLSHTDLQRERHHPASLCITDSAPVERRREIRVIENWRQQAGERVCVWMILILGLINTLVKYVYANIVNHFQCYLMPIH